MLIRTENVKEELFNKAESLNISILMIFNISLAINSIVMLISNAIYRKSE